MGWAKFFKRRSWDAERAREIEFHISAETAENIDRGLPRAEAETAARRKFGNPALVREEIYRMNTVGWLESLWQDARQTARLLRKNPGFTLVAVVSLGLGIGANTAIFELIDAVRLRELPVERPGELADLRIAGGTSGFGVINGAYGQLTHPLWLEIRQNHEPFSGVAAWSPDQFRVGRGGESRRAHGLFVSGEFFNVLGVKPWRGRLIEPADDQGACPDTTAVLSYQYWRREFGGRDIKGLKLHVDGGVKEVVGVAPPDFFGVAVGEFFDIARPFCKPKEYRREVFTVSVIGRLRPGWTVDRASSYLAGVSPGMFTATAPEGYSSKSVEQYKQFRLAAYPAASGVSFLREAFDTPLRLLLGITGLVLLMACANLANLMLARASAREREVAVRLALGASRRRLLRQMVVEGALLAGLGVAVGVTLAHWLSKLLLWSFSDAFNTIALPVATDWRVILFATGAGVLTCLLFAALPAIRATRAEPVTAMKNGGRGLTAGRERFSLQRMLVTGQVAVSFLLMAVALLFARSFSNLMTFNPGMRRAEITVAFIGFQESHLPKERLLPFAKELLDEVRQIPGVQSAATTTNVPLLGSSWTHGVTVGSTEGSSKFTWVSPEYFGTMNIPVITGRGLTDADTAAAPRVALVNQTFVRTFIGNRNPIGTTMRTGAEPGYPSTVYEIVGVIPDTRYGDLRDGIPPMTYAPASQYPSPGPWAAIMIYSSIAPAALIHSVKSRITAAHPEVEMEGEVLEDMIRAGMRRERIMAMLSGFFGAVAALLATIGLYGVISYIVNRRRNEMGLRIALGATGPRVISMMMSEAMKMVAAGLAVGIVLTLVAVRAARSLLFGLTPYDPLTLGATLLLLVLIGGLASYIPARRASRLDPMTALRCD